MYAMQKQALITTGIWTILELEWFYTTTWNLTIDHMNDWRASRVSILAKASSAVGLCREPV